VPAHNIVIGQHVTEAKATISRQFRREMTRSERTLWAALRRNQLLGLHFRRQQIIDGFIVDFYCHAAGLVIEVDGPSHAEQPEYDAERDHILAARNLRVLRLTNDEVLGSLPIAIQRIIDAIQNPLITVPEPATDPTHEQATTPAARHPLPSQGRGPGG